MECSNALPFDGNRNPWSNCCAAYLNLVPCGDRKKVVDMAGEKSELPEEKFKNSIFLKILKHGPGLFSVGMLLLLFKLIPQLWIHLFFEIVPLLTWIVI